MIYVNGVAYPACVSIASDPDHDGWGWEYNRTCRVRYPYCQSPYSDPDGDGWGWEYNQTCIAIRY